MTSDPDQPWLAAGLSTAPADWARAEAGVAAAYQSAGRTPPARIVWCDSLRDGWETIAALLADGSAGAPLVKEVRRQVLLEAYGAVHRPVYAAADEVERHRARGDLNDFMEHAGYYGEQRYDSTMKARYDLLANPYTCDPLLPEERRMVAAVAGPIHRQVFDLLLEPAWRQLRADGDQEFRIRTARALRATEYWDDDGGTGVFDQTDDVRAALRYALPDARDRLDQPAWQAHPDLAVVAMIDAYGNTGDPRWAGCAEVVASAGLWWPFETVAVLTERLVRATQG